jgi:hypothetical protein
MLLTTGIELFQTIICAKSSSAFNIIEHDWSKVSSWLAGVTFEPILEGETLPPMKQKLSSEEKSKKEV